MIILVRVLLVLVDILVLGGDGGATGCGSLSGGMPREP